MKVGKQKAQKYDIKQKLKFEDYNYCLEAIQIENKIKLIEKSKLNVGSRTESHKEFRKNYKPILKSQERFRSEKDNVFTDKVKETAFSANDDKKNTSNLFNRNICIYNIVCNKKKKLNVLI